LTVAHETMLDVVRGCLERATERLLAHEVPLLGGDDPEGVHQARVATRRLRSDLHTLRDYVDDEWASALRAELQWLGAELGTVRDIEVLRDRLREHAQVLARGEAEAASRAIRRLDADREAARAELLAMLRTPRYAELKQSLVRASADPRGTDRAARDAEDELGSVVRRPWKKLRRAVDELGDAPADSQLHAVRIRAKRCRYAAEAAAHTVGKPARKFASAVAAVQDVLGEHQDAVVARAWVDKTAPECPVAEAYALGMLAEIERRAAETSRAEFPAVWDDASRSRLRSWM
jgi:CHAD domain-containing protein